MNENSKRFLMSNKILLRFLQADNWDKYVFYYLHLVFCKFPCGSKTMN